MNKGMDAKTGEVIASYIETLGDNTFVYPGSLAAKLQVPIPEINKALLLATSEQVLFHYVIPVYRNQPVEESARLGFELKPQAFSVQDPDDFEDVDPSELELISAYKKTAR